MSLTVQTVPSAIGDIYNWQSSVTIASNVAGANTGFARVQVASDAFFVLMAFLGSTNYDQVAGDFIAVIGAGPASAATLVSPPFHPNNFQVLIKYNDDINLMGAPMAQAALCSNGFHAGGQCPFPMIFPPMTTFNFDFYNVAPTLQLTGAGVARDLVINFGLYGYFVPVPQLSNYLASWPSYAAEARKGLPGWIERFTDIEMPAGV